MAILEKSVESLKTLAFELIAQVEDGFNHPETWQKIASFTSPHEQEILKQLAHYFSQLIAIPQTEPALLLLATLEAVCLACSGNTESATSKFQNLQKKHPDSVMIRGAFNFVQQNKILPSTAPATPSAEISEQLLKAIFDFVSVQNKMNQTILQQTHDIQQTLHLVARRISRRQNQRIRCVFLVSFLQSWNTLAEVYEVMKASDDFDPIVISTARKRDKDTGNIFGEDIVHEFLESEDIPHLRLDTAKESNCMDVLKMLSPDIIFRQGPWHDLPPVFNAAEINFARLCYIPYSFTAVKRLDKDESSDVICSSRHTDLQYHRLCWRIFCETEMHKEFYVNTSIRQGENVVVTGYPKFDRLLSEKKRPAFWPIMDNQPGRRRYRIIWAPHHSVTPDVMGFGTFVAVHKEMLEWARHSVNDYEFVLKPHPALVSEVVHALKAYSQAYMDSFFAAWNALPNTALYEGGSYGSLFAGSDVMLTDGVGFLSEYQLFEKPLIFLDSGCHFGFNPVGAIMLESANKIRSISEARALCERFSKGEPDPMRTIQQTVIQRIMPYPGQSAKKIVQAIREGLYAEGV